MAGEIIKTRATCLAIRPWSRTSHIVTWLTPSGVLTTLVKGAVRPKSAFLGRYDLNYTCEILYYARAKGDLHALRECTPLERRDGLRDDFRAFALTDYFRHLARTLTPTGPEAANGLALLEETLEALTRIRSTPSRVTSVPYLQRLIDYEVRTLRLAGLAPEFDETDGVVQLRGERQMPVSADVRRTIEHPADTGDLKILVDTARVIFVYYTFHVDCAPDVRRTVLRMILQ